MKELQNTTILYVDDDIQNLVVFEYAFIKNYNVFVAQSVSKAWEILQSEKIGVIISDQRMPDQLGTDFLSEVTKKHPDILRILLTAYYDLNLVFEAINTGKVYAYVTKPWDKEDLKNKIDNALEAFNLKSRNKELVRDLSEKNKELSILNEQLKIEINEKSILNYAIEHTTEIIILIDSSGKIIYVNKAFEEYSGHFKKEIVGRELATIANHNELEFYKQLWCEVQKGVAWLGRIEYYKPNDEYSKLEINISPIFNEKSETINFVLVGRDITKEDELQELVNQKRKLEAIGTLAGGIAHDFNNILVPIQGYALLLEDDIERDTPSWDDLQQIIKATHRAKDLVDQILTFGRKRKVVHKDIHITEIIKDSLKLIKPSIPNNVTLKQEFNISNDYISADPVQIQQIIINICNNSFQSMTENGGTVFIKVSNLLIDEHNFYKFPSLKMNKEYVIIKIKDNGIGIEKNNLDKIFDPFFTTKEKGKGTGLGLSNVHGIVTSLNGDVYVESKPNEGTIFSILLPTITLQRKKQNEAIQKIDGAQKLVVAIDDDQVVLDFLSEMLAALNYKVIIFDDCLKAIDFITLNSDKVSMLFTDFNMPIMNGKELIDVLKSKNIHIPTIVITGFAAQLNTFNISNIIVEKPFKIEDISEAIQRTLNV